MRGGLDQNTQNITFMKGCQKYAEWSSRKGGVSESCIIRKGFLNRLCLGQKYSRKEELCAKF